ncbi:hypothetical protein H5410_025590 [Solanum commersonii]|uniref:Uncharacterized protein n=1 Tax=Solanum commersonii TaxID=4109 RepID=A0A9J5YUM8_SOLCO|nr:hypothetical protein H5410_025590 [Solanum commersonii]
MPACKSMYLNEGISDHCPIKITFEGNNVKTRRAFKYCNVWSKHPQFKHVILEGWGTLIDGCRMLQVVRRLKLLKKELKKLNSMHFRNIATESNEDRVSLKEVQAQLHLDSENITLQQLERKHFLKFKQSSYLAELFLQQRSKVRWIRLGDANTSKQNDYNLVIFWRSIMVEFTRAQHFLTACHAFSVCSQLIELH